MPLTTIFRRAAAAVLLALAWGCATYPDSQQPRDFSRPDIHVRLASEMPSHFDSHVRCALSRLDAVRALPEFDEQILNGGYDFTGQPSDWSSPEKVLECARRPLNLEWRARHCPLLRTWPFMREVGSTVVEEDVSKMSRMRTYGCEVTSQDTAELAGHFLHEHMHTCGYKDPAGNEGGRVVTYRINKIIEDLARQTPVCPGL